MARTMRMCRARRSHGSASARQPVRAADTWETDIEMQYGGDACRSSSGGSASSGCGSGGRLTTPPRAQSLASGAGGGVPPATPMVFVDEFGDGDFAVALAGLETPPKGGWAVRGPAAVGLAQGAAKGGDGAVQVRLGRRSCAEAERRHEAEVTVRGGVWQGSCREELC
eukprot:361613-Chlamydomonas_euryale.AAC.2